VTVKSTGRNVCCVQDLIYATDEKRAETEGHCGDASKKQTD
jgi:hypothetical protein